MAAIKKGDAVRQIVVPISGVVVGFDIDQESGDRQLLVEWTDAEGTHQKYFRDGEVEPAA